jgi:hypothetical protein
VAFAQMKVMRSLLLLCLFTAATSAWGEDKTTEKFTCTGAGGSSFEIEKPFTEKFLSSPDPNSFVIKNLVIPTYNYKEYYVLDYLVHQEKTPGKTFKPDPITLASQRPKITVKSDVSEDYDNLAKRLHRDIPLTITIDSKGDPSVPYYWVAHVHCRSEYRVQEVKNTTQSSRRTSGLK